ncbi:MAG: ABC transporter ATP-binding protein [Defluviitaleaceae bacterium]|nr:ABC transporter ATP-binding protein [Defluviitaleaceae bacterium]MCL2276082.1 ABC transporter ATP-binding protein [Defluviitaleaceae bacterium]
MQLIIDRLTKQYKNKIAVDRVSLTLSQGVHGLLGANGAGKTTLMRMMCGLLTPTGGSVAYNGIDVSREEYRDVLGYMPQHFGYYPNFTAHGFLCYLGSLKGLSKPFAKEKSEALLSQLNLTDVAKKKIKTFSGGMKQRLGIAQALLNNPKILILDEPTAGLDPKERVKFRSLIAKLGSDRIVLLSTHIVSDVEDIAHNVHLMKDGQIIAGGKVDKLLSQGQSLEQLYMEHFGDSEGENDYA